MKTLGFQKQEWLDDLAHWSVTAGEGQRQQFWKSPQSNSGFVPHLIPDPFRDAVNYLMPLINS